MMQMSNVPPASIMIDRVRAGLRPTRSAYPPSTIAPIGRIKKLTANVPNVRNIEKAALSVLKKACAM